MRAVAASDSRLTDQSCGGMQVIRSRWYAGDFERSNTPRSARVNVISFIRFFLLRACIHFIHRRIGLFFFSSVTLYLLAFSCRDGLCLGPNLVETSTTRMSLTNWLNWVYQYAWRRPSLLWKRCVTLLSDFNLIQKFIISQWRTTKRACSIFGVVKTFCHFAQASAETCRSAAV